MPKLNPQNAGMVLAAYLDQEVVPKASGLQKVGAIIAGTVAVQKAEPLIRQYASTLKFADVMDEEGMIDLDKAYTLTKDAFKKSGKIQVMGLLLDDGDIEILNGIARQYAQ